MNDKMLNMMMNSLENLEIIVIYYDKIKEELNEA
jgi:hypothetical protein